MDLGVQELGEAFPHSGSDRGQSCRLGFAVGVSELTTCPQSREELMRQGSVPPETLWHAEPCNSLLPEESIVVVYRINAQSIHSENSCFKLEQHRGLCEIQWEVRGGAGVGEVCQSYAGRRTCVRSQACLAGHAGVSPEESPGHLC